MRFGRFGITKFSREKIYDLDLFSVFHFAFAKSDAEAAANVRIARGLPRPAWRARMWPASPQSITRCAMLMPAPATLVAAVYIHHPADRAAVHAHAHPQV